MAETGAQVEQLGAGYGIAGHIPVAEPIPVAGTIPVAEDGMAGPIPVAGEVPGAEPWVPGGEGLDDQELHATIPIQT